MRTVISLAVGFWLGRQIYLKYSKEEALQKERRLKERLKKVLEDTGLSKSEAKEQTSNILQVGI